MFTFLIIDDSEDIIELGGLVLESSYDAKVIGFVSTEQAMAFIKDGTESCDAVICDYNMAPYDGGDIYKAVREHRGNLPFVLMSGNSLDCAKKIPINFLDNRYNVFLEKPFSLSYLKELMLELFQGATICGASIFTDYCSIPSKFLSPIEESPVSLFAKLGNDKFIQIARPDEVFCNDFAMRASSKSETFYTRYDDFDELIDYLLLQRKISPSVESYSDVDAVELSHIILSELGVSDKLIAFAMEQVNSVIESIEKCKELRPVFLRLQNSKAHQLYQHSVLSAFISAILAHEIGFTDQKTIRKLVLAALFHDSALSADEFLSLEKSQAELVEDVNFKGPKSFFSHPLRGALYFKGDFAHTDICKIIEQHHERPDGTGFPRRLGADSIDPLSALFIISESFSCYLVATGLNQTNAISWVNCFYDFYNVGRYKKAIAGLRATINAECI